MRSYWSTAAAFLRQRAWSVSEQELDELLTRGYASELRTDVLRRVASTVPDQEARELLFRAAEVLASLAETAIALYRSDGAHAAFLYMDEAAFTLLHVRNDSVGWRDLAVAIAYTVVYLHAAASAQDTTAPPQVAGEHLAEPKPGMFFRQHSTRHTLFTEDRVHVLRLSMVRFADAMNNDERLMVWLAEARSAGSLDAIPDTGRFGALFEAVDLVAKGLLREGARRAIEARLPTVSAIQVVLMLTIALATKAIHDPDAALTEGRELGRWLKMVPTDFDDAGLWQQVILVVETGLDPTASIGPVVDLANDANALDYVRVAALLAMSSRHGQAPTNALGAHINAAMYVLRERQVLMQLHRRLLLPYICNYWQQLISRAGFRFRLPKQAREAVAEATSAPVEVRAQRILREVAWGLGAHCSPGVRSWLNEDAL